ncbi:substrate-binding periplasmic protein [Duganella qianjiadongensis]|uniref:Transporter substrate-binding domain-containing protein n=1 Tax=Duganella qianjiadongensis TaxID=2692176 RepID=A0ABW9VQJ4_9BURK|nr:ABC transporter substrate-binding protein [Duganella qianjiadongensis]MYM41834.1 transporter substrate-binding domain-containing protein [Duganella qianjiadongensis]
MTVLRAVTPALFFLALATAHAAGSCPPARAGISDLGFTAYREAGTFGGSNVDLLHELQRRSGCPIELIWFPHGRLYAQFYDGQLELTGASLRTPERDRYGVWLPYTYTQFELVLRNDSAGKFHSLAEFVEHSTARLNVPRGISYSRAALAQMQRLQQQGRLEYVNDYEAVFRKIVAGRAEGTLASPTIHLRYQRQHQLLGQMKASFFSESPRTIVGLYVSRRVAPEIRRRYADSLRSIIGDGSVQRYNAHYLGEEISRQMFLGGMQEILDAMPRQP